MMVFVAHIVYVFVLLTCLDCFFRMVLFHKHSCSKDMGLGVVRVSLQHLPQLLSSLLVILWHFGQAMQ